MQASGSSGVDGPCSSDAHQQVREAQAAFAAGVRGRRKAQALHLLRALQQQAQRQPRWVLQAAEELLSHHAGSLGLFEWDLREQAFLAYADEGRLINATKMVEELRAKFGDGSKRVTRNRLMLAESALATLEAGGVVPSQVLQRAFSILPDFLAILRQREDNLSAEDLSEAINELDDAYARLCTPSSEGSDAKPHPLTDVACWKRRVALHKGQKGQRGVAVELLCELLQSAPTDVDAWAELAALYLRQGRFSDAADCYEKLILLSPQSYLHHLNFAECLLSAAGSAATGMVSSALDHFSLSLSLRPDHNARALFGVISCCKRLQDTDSEQYLAAKQALNELYSAENPALCESVLEWTGAPGSSSST